MSIFKKTALCFCIALVGCNNNDDSQGAGNAAASQQLIFGQVATGSALTDGKVTLKSKNGEVTKPINADGTYSFDVSSLSGPFYLKATSNKDTTVELYSYSNEAGRVNVTPLTTAVLYNASAKISPQAPFLAGMPISDEMLKQAQSQVKAILGKTLRDSGVNPENTDFFATPFSTNHFGVDAVLDSVSVAVSGNKLIVFPKDGIPFDIANTPAPTPPTAAELKQSKLIEDLTKKLTPGVKDAQDIIGETVDRLVTLDVINKTIVKVDELDINPAVFVLNGVTLSVLKAKAIDIFKVVLLRHLEAKGTITSEEKNFINTLDNAAFGTSFLEPYVNLVNCKIDSIEKFTNCKASDGLELKLYESFNKTRPGKWLSYPNQAAKDTRPVVQFLLACPLPTRIYENLFSFAYNSENSECADKNNALPVAQIDVDTLSAKEGETITLDASKSSDANNDELFYSWKIKSTTNAIDLVMVNKSQKKAYLFAPSVTTTVDAVIELTVTDSKGATSIKTTSIRFKPTTPAVNKPPVISGLTAYTAGTVVSGAFTISDPDANGVSNLTVSVVKDSKSCNIDAGQFSGAQGSISKNFQQDCSGLLTSTGTYYVTVEARTDAGTLETVSEAVGFSYVSSTPEPTTPTVSDVSCPNVISNTASTCTVNGSNLPDGLVAKLGNTTCSGGTGSTIQRIFNCTPNNQAGDLPFTVISNGTVIKQINVLVKIDSGGTPTPTPSTGCDVTTAVTCTSMRNIANGEVEITGSAANSGISQQGIQAFKWPTNVRVYFGSEHLIKNATWTCWGTAIETNPHIYQVSNLIKTGVLSQPYTDVDISSCAAFDASVKVDAGFFSDIYSSASRIVKVAN